MRNDQMQDVLGMEMHIGDNAIMWSDNAGKQLYVKVLDYNPVTRKIKVERQDPVNEWRMKVFWTNYYANKFYVLIGPAGEAGSNT